MSPDVVLLHRGALGDSVLLWPRLRALAREGKRVWFVTDRSKALLAERELGVAGVDAEGASWNTLWRERSGREPMEGVGLVVDHLSGGAEPFASNLAVAFPGARIETSPPPKGGDEARAWVSAHPLGAAEPRENAHGPVVVHVGAGSTGKRWPLARFCWLAHRMRDRGRVEVVAGEAEAERFDAGERAMFAAAGGRFIEDLAALADTLRRARLYVGCDSGPTHLAAQLGVPTLGLFGPTDPRVWGPVGPGVRVVAPPAACAMEWLAVETVEAAARAFVPGPPPA